MFWLKKAVSFWLMPLPLCAALLVAGCFFLLLNCSRRFGQWLVVGATALLVLFSSEVASVQMLRPLEYRYPAVPEAGADGVALSMLSGCRYVAVLGSGNSTVAGIAATGLLSASGLARLIEGVRVLRLLPEAQLIVSGPGAPGQRSHAAVLAAAAESLGVDPHRILLLETAQDTEEESQAVAHMVQGGRTALVTSAWHMPRAAQLFRKASVSFVACPTDYVARSDGVIRWTGLRIDSESLQRSTLAVHEWIGLAWNGLRGKR